jgi:alpha-ketoglutarate-dependent taurine dioxygenase
MKIEIDKNGWTVHAYDINPAEFTAEQGKTIAGYVGTNTTVIMHSLPKMSLQEYQDFAHKLGNAQQDSSLGNPYFDPNSNREVIRVTGEKDEHGNNKGLFSQKEELTWHANECGRQDRPDALCLYAVSGTAGSVTSFSNTILAYEDLKKATDAPAELLANVDNYEAYYDYGANLDDVRDSIVDPNYKSPSGKQKVVYTNKFGNKGIFYSIKQRPRLMLNNEYIHRKTNLDIRTYLDSFLTQEKYVYDHHWKDGDCILNCQWLSLHRRLEFESIEQRWLWRIMLSFPVQPKP